MPDVHLTDEQLPQYRDGVLWNPMAGHLRSCAVCQNRLRDARLLRELLARPEQKKSAHPSPEELAYFLEGWPAGMAFTKVEAHVAGCPQCFADLQAIREQLQPGPIQEEKPPEWVVAKAVRDFHPPEVRLELGTLLVRWFNKIGPWLRLIPPAVAHPFPDASLFEEENARLAPAKALLMPAEHAAYDMTPPSDGSVPSLPAESKEPPAEEPVDFTMGHLNVRISPQGRARDQVALTVAVTQSADNAPVPGVQLYLESEEGPRVTVTTDDNGAAALPLPQGQATLVFHSPVHAELKISS